MDRASRQARAAGTVVGRWVEAHATTALAILLAVGLAVRLVIALVVTPRSGFPSDLDLLARWAEVAYASPAEFYRQPENAAVVTYPPAYLFVLWSLAAMSDLVGAGPRPSWELIKAPPMVADLAIGFVVYRFARLLAGPSASLVSASIFVLNPAVIFDSTVWGQNDSAGMAAALAALYLVARDRMVAAAPVAVVAAFVKFQFAWVIPIGLVIAARRLVTAHRRGDAGSYAARLGVGAAAGFAVAGFLTLPWGVSLFDPGNPGASVAHRFGAAEAAFPWVTLDAFNLWTNPLLGNMRLDASGMTYGVLVHDPIPLATIAGLTVTSRGLGLWLFLGVAFYALVSLVRRDDVRAVLVATALIVTAFFVLPTRIHERYLFPLLAVAAPLAASAGTGWRLAYAFATLTAALNMYFVYTLPNAGTDLERIGVLSSTILTPAGIYILAAAPSSSSCGSWSRRIGSERPMPLVRRSSPRQ